jgi:mono/diheme cytochrome c family protein
VTDGSRALALVLSLGVLSGVGTAVLQAHQRTTALARAFTHAERGGVLFANDCETCHGVGGDGAGGAPALNDGSVLKSYPTLSALQTFIQKNMPASDPGILSNSEARDAAEYVLWLNRRLP